jgi:hypothetical protein
VLCASQGTYPLPKGHTGIENDARQWNGSSGEHRRASAVTGCTVRVSWRSASVLVSSKPLKPRQSVPDGQCAFGGRLLSSSQRTVHRPGPCAFKETRLHYGNGSKTHTWFGTARLYDQDPKSSRPDSYGREFSPALGTERGERESSGAGLQHLATAWLPRELR